MIDDPTGSCPRALLTPGQIATIVRLERAGRADLAEAVRTGAMRCGQALETAGLRKPRATKPNRATSKPSTPANENEPEPVDHGPATGYEAALRFDRDSTWLEFDAAAIKRLDILQGDAVLVICEYACDEGPPERVTRVGMLGAPMPRKPDQPHVARIWMPETFDFDAVQSVVLKRRRLT